MSHISGNVLNMHNITNMADRRVFMSALFLLSYVLVVVLKTLRFRTGLQCKTHSGAQKSESTPLLYL